MIDQLEYGMSSEQLLNQLFGAIDTVKKFRTLMKDALVWIRRHYSTDMYLWEFTGSDYFTKVTDGLKCELLFNLRTKKLTMKSRLDPKLKVTIQLYREKEWFEFVDKEQKKEELEKIRERTKLYKK